MTNHVSKREGSQVSGHQPALLPESLNVNLKAKNVDNVKWAAKQLIRNLEILAALDKTDPRYEIYREAALQDKHNIDLHLEGVL